MGSLLERLRNVARAVLASLPEPIRVAFHGWRMEQRRRRLSVTDQHVSALLPDGTLNRPELRRRLELALFERDLIPALLAPVDDLPDTPGLIHAAIEEDALSERALNLLLARLFAAKRLETYEALSADSTLGHDALRAYYRARLAAHRAEKAGRFDAVHAQFETLQPTGLAREQFLRLLVQQAAGEGQIDWLASYLGASPVSDVAGLPHRLLYGAIAALIHGGRPDMARNVLERTMDALPPLTRLMLLLPARAVLGAEFEPDLATQQDILSRLGDIRRAQLRVGADPNWDWVKAAFASIQAMSAETLMDMRTDPAQLERFDALILSALQQETPLFFLRLGDGESYRLPAPDDVALDPDLLAKDAAMREVTWWDEAPAAPVKAAMVARMKAATHCADMLGVPTAYRFVGDAVVTKPYGEMRTDRAMIQVLHHIQTDARLSKTILTEDTANQRAFTQARLTRYARAARHVIYVGCWTREALAFPADISATWILVTPSKRISLDQPEGARSILHDYEAIEAEVRAASGPGTLLLLAAGYASKGLGTAVRQEGGVALDVGAAVDLMAGANTRLLTGVL